MCCLTVLLRSEPLLVVQTWDLLCCEHTLIRHNIKTTQRPHCNRTVLQLYIHCGNLISLITCVLSCILKLSPLQKHGVPPSLKVHICSLLDHYMTLCRRLCVYQRLCLYNLLVPYHKPLWSCSLAHLPQTFHVTLELSKREVPKEQNVCCVNYTYPVWPQLYALKWKMLISHYIIIVHCIMALQCY